MKTCVYMVRHGESPKTEGNERTRGLTEKGQADAYRVTERLRGEGIQTFLSSPYLRAVDTLVHAARAQGQEVRTIEELKEIVFLDGGRIVPEPELLPLVKRMFADPDYALPGGESLRMCEQRVVRTLKHVLQEHAGQKVAIGTHGGVMTLMMGHFDSQYDLDFLLRTSKPDIYKLEFEADALVGVERLW